MSETIIKASSAGYESMPEKVSDESQEFDVEELLTTKEGRKKIRATVSRDYVAPTLAAGIELYGSKKSLIAEVPAAHKLFKKVKQLKEVIDLATKQNEVPEALQAQAQAIFWEIAGYSEAFDTLLGLSKDDRPEEGDVDTESFAEPQLSVDLENLRDLINKKNKPGPGASAKDVKSDDVDLTSNMLADEETAEGVDVSPTDSGAAIKSDSSTIEDEDTVPDMEDVVFQGLYNGDPGHLYGDKNLKHERTRKFVAEKMIGVIQKLGLNEMESEYLFRKYINESMESLYDLKYRIANDQTVEKEESVGVLEEAVVSNFKKLVDSYNDGKINLPKQKNLPRHIRMEKLRASQSREGSDSSDKAVDSKPVSKDKNGENLEVGELRGEVLGLYIDSLDKINNLSRSKKPPVNTAVRNLVNFYKGLGVAGNTDQDILGAVSGAGNSVGGSEEEQKLLNALQGKITAALG